MFQLIYKTKETLRADLLSGLTVALALVPEAVAFSFVAGVEPLVGLYAAFIVGLVTAIFGGRPGMISGATGALAVVMVSLVALHGVEYLFATVVLMGILQVLAGSFGMGKFIRLIPHPVMLGFVNGLAIVIFIAQLSAFKTADSTGMMAWMQGTELYLMLGLVALTMAIIYFLPKLTKAIPSALAGILVVSGLVHLLGLETKSVGDLASVAGGFPSLHIPMVPLNLETLKIIFPYAAILAAIGLIESLMTLQLVDEVTETKGQPNRECLGQGLANIITGFFGGMGGCAMIGQSMINVNSGGRGRMSGISAALFLLFFIVVGSSLIELIPVAALTGVMFMVVIGTFEWSSFRLLGKVPKSDAFVILLVSIVTVFTDLAIAVLCGVIFSCLVFAWKKSSYIEARTADNEEGTKTYSLSGTLFFGSTQSFMDKFDPQNDPETVNVDFANIKIFDFSSVEVIGNLIARYEKYGKKLKLVNLSPDCRSSLDKFIANHHYS